MGKHIDDRGVPVSMTEGNGVDNLVSELSQGHRVIVAIDSGELWNPGASESIEDMVCGHIPDHAVIVDGVSISSDTFDHPFDPSWSSPCFVYLKSPSNTCWKG